MRQPHSHDFSTTGDFATNELACAAFLNQKGFGFKVGTNVENPKEAIFLFSAVSEDERESLREAVESFKEGRARVEPRKFAQDLAQVRAAMYDLLDSAVA